MQEHFNENYMETEKFPKSTFKGKIEDLSKVNFTKDGTYPVIITGEMTIHGVTKPFSCSGTLDVQAGKIVGKSSYKIIPEDYGIIIPSVVREKVAKEMEITVTMNYEPYTGK
jgi:polyisoprenoid-binding protein YceI